MRGSGGNGVGTAAGGAGGVATAPGRRVSIGALVRGPGDEQAASVPRIQAWATTAKRDLMGWIVFEALLALAVMLAVVWWTFRGRADTSDDPDEPDAEVPTDKQR
jgi:hypothetical protein